MNTSRKWPLLLVALGVAAIVIPFLMPGADPQSIKMAESRAPWAITSHSDGTTEVFGVRLGQSSLGDSLAALEADAQIALILNRDRPATLEAYIESVNAGFVTGKMVLTARLPQTLSDAMQTRAVKVEAMPSGARRLHLGVEDRQQARAAPIEAITFIPSVNLDEATVLQRFGTPGERIRQDAQTEHFLYAGKGLDLTLATDGKELLQYVAPRDFARLREPLSTTAPASTQ